MPSLLIAKKVIGLLVLPSGMIWLGLMILVGWPGLGRWGRCLAMLILGAYTVAGNAWVGSLLLGKLESPYAAMAHPAEPFDAICVLGGGSSVTPNGHAQPLACQLATKTHSLQSPRLLAPTIFTANGREWTRIFWFGSHSCPSASIRGSQPVFVPAIIKSRQRLHHPRRELQPPAWAAAG